MPHIDDVLSDHKLTDQQQAVLTYLQAHPNEVFSSEDVEELRAKVRAGAPASLGASLETLYRMGCIERQKVRARYFYGSSEAISRLRTRMTETASERGQREA
jgi:Fe2+ or Zn2+ uptake regulation protein